MIEYIRSFLKLKKLNGLILNGLDPHLSEYLPHWWQIRKELSNFSGSNGILCITEKSLGLWTDSRYSIQARKEVVDGDVFIEEEENCITISKWLEIHNAGKKIGIVADNFSYSKFRQYCKDFQANQLDLLPVESPISFNEAYITHGEKKSLVYLSPEISGKSYSEKISSIREKIDSDSFVYIVTELDSIAWMLNLRGDDIPFNPLFYAYCIIMPESVFLFTDSLLPYAADGISVRPYNQFSDFVKTVDTDEILLDPKRTNSDIVLSLKKIDKDLRFIDDIVSGLKAVKNEIEINGFYKALVSDSVLMSEVYAKFIFSSQSKEYNEYDLTQSIINHKTTNPEYIQESFYPIVAHNQNSAVCHYSATEKNGNTFNRNGILLIDSGSHFKTGTTDMTRTWFLGSNCPADYITDYTLVLKAHIALATAVFPKGATGAQLDAICRNEIWKSGNDYGHGTGHGVGHRLCVHEGSVRISPKAVDCTLKPGMVISNEPGLYHESRYGIRLENMILCCKLNDDFLHFKTMTLFPFDERSIDRSMLTLKEKKWLNSYYSQIKEVIYPKIEDLQAKEWLNIRIKNHNF